jgi:hypothetical protein
MTKKTAKAIQFYNEMLADNVVHSTWTHEDYEDTTVYEDINGDIVCVRRNEAGEIIEAWLE